MSGKTFKFAPNDRDMESLSITFAGGAAEITITDSRGEHCVICGSDTWLNCETTLGPGPISLATTPKNLWHWGLQSKSWEYAATGAWTSADTYSVNLVYNETPFVVTLIFKFDGDTVEFSNRVNVSFGPTEWPALTGHT